MANMLSKKCEKYFTRNPYELYFTLEQRVNTKSLLLNVSNVN